ncbi:MAG: redoxin domain-containing protein [Rubricoccaceae bacterium]
MAIQTGQPAPDFTLYDDAMQPFTLSEAVKSSKVVLLFFPGAFTSVCTTELNTVANDYGRYEDLGADVVGLSTDSPFALAEFKKVNGFPFRLLSDHDAEVAAAYGAKYDRDFTPMKLDRIAKRAAFVVDQSGQVVYAEVLDNAGQQPNFDAIFAAVENA